MMRIKCTVGYDGSQYRGWQTQNNAPSIQKLIEKALFRIHKRHIPIHASGRTDGAVHALSQVFHFDTDINISPERWSHAINGVLPNDIYIHKTEFVEDTFHSRHSCIKKIYEYRLSFPSYDVHREKYCLQLRKPLDLEAMKEACTIFIGTHDFTSFNANRLEERPYQIKTIDDISIRQEGQEWVIQFTGNGFLRYMVRMMVGCLIEVGYGRLSKETIKFWLESKDKTCCKHNAPPQGLYLKEVFY